jgi:hypothetical protein
MDSSYTCSRGKETCPGRADIKDVHASEELLLGFEVLGANKESRSQEACCQRDMAEMRTYSKQNGCTQPEYAGFKGNERS